MLEDEKDRLTRERMLGLLRLGLIAPLAVRFINGGDEGEGGNCA